MLPLALTRVIVPKLGRDCKLSNLSPLSLRREVRYVVATEALPMPTTAGY